MAIIDNFSDYHFNFWNQKTQKHGWDLGSAFKGFKKAVNDETEKPSPPSAVDDAAEVMSETIKKEEEDS